MTHAHSSKSRSEPVLGVLYAFSAFLIWGLSPFYWKALGAVPALEIIVHRIIWSFVFLLPLVFLQRRWKEFIDVVTNRRMLIILLSTGILVGCNWLLYIWAVNNDHLLQASLGYYINPLVNVVLGVIFLRERLRQPQILAVLLATAGVLYLTIHHGVFPWISITLALTFGFYGLIRKVVSLLRHKGDGVYIPGELWDGFTPDGSLFGHCGSTAFFYAGRKTYFAFYCRVATVYRPQRYVPFSDFCI